jgi:hypothetical protein
MAEGIVYLDVDDEITSAAQRIRSAPGTKVALVVPYGSRIATSRMNFRLLSREAVVSNRRLSIVSGDAAARSLAASAGLPVFGTVPEYEAAVARPPDDRGGNERAGGTASGPPRVDPTIAGDLAASETVVAAGRPGGPEAPATGSAGDTAASGGGSPAAPVAPVPPPGRKSQAPKRPPPEAAALAVIDDGPGSGPWAGVSARERAPDAEAGADREQDDRLAGRNRAPLLAALGLAGLAVIVAAVAGYLFLPSAPVALTPRRDAIGPIQLTVAADPTVTEVDPINDVVPALRLDVPVQAMRTFPTTGTKVKETRAGGSVTFTNYDPTSSNTVPAGSIVSTEGGIRFQTLATLIVPHAAFTPPSTTVPSQASVQVQAVQPGVAGNVPANAIRVVPPGENPLFLAVANPNQTSGGTHTETPQVTKAEVDKAVLGVQDDLQAAFRQAVAAGAAAPPGTTLFPATAKLGDPTPDVDPKTLVGQAIESFTISLSAHGSVIAVDPSPIADLARGQLQAQVAKDHRLIPDSVDIAVGQGGVAEDDQVTFEATARAIQVAVVDVNALRGLVKGKTADQAKAALVPYGSATVTIWPDWASTVTGVDARLTVTVDDSASGAPSGGAGGSPGPSPSPLRPSAVPPGSATPAPSANPPSDQPSSAP